MVHCALVTVDDHDRTAVDSRVIDIDLTDRLDRAGRLNSGVDLMLEQAAAADLVGHRHRRRHPRREDPGRGRRHAQAGVHVVADAEAIGRALAQTGTVAARPRVIVVDAGDSGTSVFAIDTSTGPRPRPSAARHCRVPPSTPHSRSGRPRR